MQFLKQEAYLFFILIFVFFLGNIQGCSPQKKISTLPQEVFYVDVSITKSEINVVDPIPWQFKECALAVSKITPYVVIDVNEISTRQSANEEDLVVYSVEGEESCYPRPGCSYPVPMSAEDFLEKAIEIFGGGYVVSEPVHDIRSRYAAITAKSGDGSDATSFYLTQVYITDSAVNKTTPCGVWKTKLN